jgi:predicted amidohydrolase
MRDLHVAAAQFEHHDADKVYNLSRIDALAGRAARAGARIVSFHECAITGYTFLRRLDRAALSVLAEPVPDGPSTAALVDIARRHDVVVMAGLIEAEGDRLFKTYVTAGPGGYVTRFRKLHPFINPHITPGAAYHVLEIEGLRAGFLVCYDNNLPENVRITALMGAEVIFAPHVTGGTTSPMPGRGTIDPALWDRRTLDPEPLRREVDGMKGREWLMRWLPARAWENGVYIVFANAIGRDDETIKPGLAMIVDPFGDVQAESRVLDDDVVVTRLESRKLEQAPGRRYLQARRPELYGRLSQPLPEGQVPVTKPGWDVDAVIASEAKAAPSAREP